jgi:hypothetical protein
LLDHLAKAERRTAHIQKYYDAERRAYGFERRNFLFHAIFVNGKIRAAEIGDRFTGGIDNTDVQFHHSRIDADRVVVLCKDSPGYGKKK